MLWKRRLYVVSVKAETSVQLTNDQSWKEELKNIYLMRVSNGELGRNNCVYDFCLVFFFLYHLSPWAQMMQYVSGGDGVPKSHSPTISDSFI